MSELLLELFSEEIPARMQMRAAEEFKRLVEEGLKKENLPYTTALAFVTPRRLMVAIGGLPEQQPSSEKTRKGPPQTAPEKTLMAFATTSGAPQTIVRDFPALRPNTEPLIITVPYGNALFAVQETPKGLYYFVTERHEGKKVRDVMPLIVGGAIMGMQWPKSMRWSTHRFSWVRPLHSIIALLDGSIIEADLNLGDEKLSTGNRTFGHRFLSPNEIFVNGFIDYKRKLQEAKVILDPDERRAVIARQAEEAAKREGLTVKRDAGLLDEVTGLVEWPVVLVGSIDRAYMELPPEVLTTSMRAHQKYFALLTADGALAPRFIVVSNMETDEQGRKNIIAGNERVLRARLSDAKFFWDQDRNAALETRLPALKTRVFQARLGTVADKVERMVSLLSKIAPAIPGADLDVARQAAGLCKADLSTGMVGEFPELQGVMGRYYALKEGLPAAVADTIRDHYAPLGPNDRCPTAPVSVAVALADRVDTLAGFWKIGEKPTGSKDPFALRRAALGVIRLIIENKIRMSLRPVLEKAAKLAQKTMSDVQRRSAGAFATPTLLRRVPGWDRQIDADVIDLLAFFADRLKVHLREQGVRHDLISAVFSQGGDSDIVRILARVEALKDFLETNDGANLLVAYRRASNIVEIEEKKDGCRYDAEVDEALLREPEEKMLAASLNAARKQASMGLQFENFAGAMVALAYLRGPVDAFFDKVTVNAPEADLRANRLRLLSEIRRTLSAVADFSKIEG